jgi:hypothetical protein
MLNRAGPRAADVMWTFFGRHRLASGIVDPDDNFGPDQDFAWDAGLGRSSDF